MTYKVGDEFTFIGLMGELRKVKITSITNGNSVHAEDESLSVIATIGDDDTITVESLLDKTRLHLLRF